ncbi:hypothetical protein Ciccas_005685 [Cichlidogyrus casuarinus]|uniref:Uncharacterized protein n=1 Tax=Cichlidogyrus casuarinus TaxID=1844966 RepID=A0ABD2Q7Y3_9PLAT
MPKILQGFACDQAVSERAIFHEKPNLDTRSLNLPEDQRLKWEHLSAAMKKAFGIDMHVAFERLKSLKIGSFSSPDAYAAEVSLLCKAIGTNWASVAFVAGTEPALRDQLKLQTDQSVAALSRPIAVSTCCVLQNMQEEGDTPGWRVPKEKMHNLPDQRTLEE